MVRNASPESRLHVAPCARRALYGASAVTYTADPRVDACVEALPGGQQAICREVRDLVHAADPEVTETTKYTDRPYFVLEGNVCALLAAKDHVYLWTRSGEDPSPSP
jgi:hypothetical protein